MLNNNVIQFEHPANFTIFDEKKNEVEKNNNVNNNLRQRKIILSPNKFFKMTSESVDSLKRNEGESLLNSLGDLDIMLGNIKSKFTKTSFDICIIGWKNKKLLL